MYQIPDMQQLGYGVDDEGMWFRFPLWAELVPLIFQIDSGTHASSYPEATRGCLPGFRAAVA